MQKRFTCAGDDYQPVPIRTIMRLYMLASGVAVNEALNCGVANDNQFGAEIGEQLKATMNRWKTDGLDIETGRVDYQRLAMSDVFIEYRGIVTGLRCFDPAVFATDDERKAFWINIYNVLMIHGVIAYQAQNSVQDIRGTFERVAYIIGGLRYSLDDIEHGILRKNRGHIAIPGTRFVERDPRRQNVLEQFDPRIHFTLVCGSTSCPPIGIYQARNLDFQMDLAAKNFIDNGGVVLNKDEMTVSLSKIFQWYSSDFGGGWMGFGSKAPVLRYVAQFLEDRDNAQFLVDHAETLKVTYQPYDWSLNA